jgi:hypothetical protein
VTKIWTPSQIKEAIQLQYIIFEELSSYKEKVELEEWEFPDFRDRCPLCEGSDCPKRIGYYDRGVTEESGEQYRIKIARYLCHRKGAQNSLHRTFSLLPYQLIPYFSHTIDLSVDIVNFWLEGNSILEVQDYAGILGVEEPLDISSSTLYRLKEIMEEAFDKAVIQGDYEGYLEGGLEGFLKVCKEFDYQLEDRELVGPLAISLDYYYRSGGYFLFGAPSQQRIKITSGERQRKNFFSDTQPRYPP